MGYFERKQLQQYFAGLIETALNRARDDAENGKNETMRERASAAACALDYLWKEFTIDHRW